MGHDVGRARALSTWPVVPTITGCRETGAVTVVATKMQKVGWVTHWVHVQLATTDTGGRADVGGRPGEGGG